MEQRKVIIIEDDVEICELLKIHLADLDCALETYGDGLEGLEAIKKNEADLVILDIKLPSMDGIELCQKVRALDITVPIIMLTARSEEIDRVLGLEVGADDYMTKPFSVREFIARVKAIFRRSKILAEQLNQKEDPKRLSFPGLTIDIDLRKVLVGEKKVELSPKEFDLLVLMASHPGKSYNRRRLLSLIWGVEFEGYEHTVNSHINRLRAKIEPSMDSPTFILTTW
ncbi:MAG TPA: DNA-binding response regulator, partial [Cytophagales bacterium]|nr:DNA-binding response regulator [Cytophagales bacterium]